MSIEAQLSELTEAVKENSELLKILTSSARKGLDEQATTKPATRSRAAAKADDETESKPRTTRSRTAKPKVPTATEVRKQTEEFLNVTDEDEYAARRKIVKSIVDKYDAPKMTELAEEDRAAALADLANALKEREEGDQGGDEDDDDVV